MALEIFALVVMVVVAAVAIWLVVVVGNLPGNIARDRQHPQSEAITVLGWVGLVTMGLGWFLALVWAYSKPLASITKLDELQQRVDELERATGPREEEQTV